MKGEMERFWCSELTVWYLCVVCALNSPGVLNIALMIRNPLLCDARLQPLALRVALLALIMLFWMWTSTKAFGPWLFLSHVIHGNSYRAEQQSCVLCWESPAMWTGRLLWLASGDVSLYALMIAWPEQFQTVNRAAAVSLLQHVTFIKYCTVTVTQALRGYVVARVHT